ncbi:hypothetical protein [Sphingobium mellinum]|uniref:hypothetical protein n=1 Tax=Sphingobium mellinum TaxID=1387166 RepID=UPI0030EBC327
MKRAAALCLLLLCWSLGMSRAHAAPAEGPAPAPRLTDAQLDAQRGGFVVSGVDIRLGVEMRTYIGGSLVLQTNISWSDQGMAVDRSVSSALAPATAETLGAAGFGPLLERYLGSGGLFLANEGRTALLQRADGSLQTMILNSASNVALRQEIDAKLDLGGFSPFQTAILTSKLGAAFGAMVGAYGR